MSCLRHGVLVPSTSSGGFMFNVFSLLALLLAAIAALLCLAPQVKLLNFVHYAPGRSVARINRYAAARLLLPAGVSLACAWLAGTAPELTVPLIFPVMLSVLAAVVWIAAGVTRLAAEIS
jgi:hypothetical protein